MDFWNWKSRYVKLTTIKWMDFGSVLEWTSKTFRELVFILNVITQSSLKWFDSYLMNFMIYGFLFGEKQTHFSQKSISSWKKHDLFWNFAIMFYLMNSTRIKVLMEKSLLESMHYCYVTTKKHLWAQKNTKEIDFQNCKFLSFFIHPTMHLP